MVRSLGLVLAFILLLFLISPSRELLFPTGANRTAVRVVDPAGQVAAARRGADYPVLAPAGLGRSWRATSSRLLPAPGAPGGTVGLHIGYVTPAGRYAELAESDGTDLLRRELGVSPTALPPVTVNGRPWRQWRTSRSELALTYADRQRTVVVTGSAGLPELRRLVASLREG